MMEKTLTDNLRALFAAFEQATGSPPGSVARRALNDNTWAARVLNTDAGFNVRSYDRIVAWLAQNWPEGVAWPEGVPTPDGFRQKIIVTKTEPPAEG